MQTNLVSIGEMSSSFDSLSLERIIQIVLSVVQVAAKELFPQGKSTNNVQLI